MFWKKKKKDNVSYTELKIEIPTGLPTETYIKGMNVIEREQDIRVQIGDIIRYRINGRDSQGVVVGSYFSLGWREPEVIGWHLIISKSLPTNEDSSIYITTGELDEISLNDVVITVEERRIKNMSTEDIIRDVKVYCGTCIYNCYDECPLKKYNKI